MFHVATMMPNHETSEDLKLEKKRHVGNDVVTIVFLDAGCTFDPTAIRTQFTQVFLLVSAVKHNNRTYFRMQAVKRDQIGSFGPSMPACLYPPSEQTRAFILTKMINAERAAMETTVFAEKTTRARAGIIRDVVTQHKALRGKKSKVSLMKKENSQKALARPVATTMTVTRAQRRPSLSAMDLAIPVRFAASSATESPSQPTESGAQSARAAAKKSPSSGGLSSGPASSSSPNPSPGSSTNPSPRKLPKSESSALLSPEAGQGEKKKTKHKRQKSSSSIPEESDE